MRKTLCLLIAFCALAPSCKDEEEADGKCADGSGNCACGLAAEDSGRYIIRYEDNPSGAFVGDTASPLFLFSQDSVSVLSMTLCSSGGIGYGLAKSREISQELGDTSFNSHALCREAFTYGGVQYGNDVDSFSIFCDRRYDSIHAAGTPLDDIVAVRFPDPYAFVANGYSLPPSTRYSGGERDGHSQVLVWYTDTLSNVDFCSHPHISYCFFLDLLTPPEQTGTYVFYGRTVMSNGAVFEGPIASAQLEGKGN